jgi:hypothetical protein
LALLMLVLGAGAAQAATSLPPQPTGGYSAPLLYNLGNADAREGKVALAVLNYERARLLTPHDPDLQANLRYVRSTAGLPPDHASWFQRLSGLAGANTYFWLGCAGVCIAGASILAHQRYSRHRGVLLTATGIGLTLMTGALCNAAATWPVMNEAVVMTPDAPAHVAPVIEAESQFTLPQAQIVRIEAQRGDFALVHTQAGRTGWVARPDLARVVPQRDE